ncbi:DUF1471 domain-containing protein [Enterobacteriaceae bacterium ESL0689]|nr:DUF1471 domain-containing protein [Enterobacteriaceae bacterium ESL0689]
MKRYLTLSYQRLSAATVAAYAKPAECAYADCVTGLNEIGFLFINNITGSQQDAEHAIAMKAGEQGASWYRIIRMRENLQPDNWWVQAILYA